MNQLMGKHITKRWGVGHGLCESKIPQSSARALGQSDQTLRVRPCLPYTESYSVTQPHAV